MSNVDKKQAMRPALADVIDYVNTGVEISADLKELESELAQSISDTADGIISAISAQPDWDNVFTDVISGVSLTVTNGIRIGGIISFDLNITTDSSGAVVQNTIMAKPAKWIVGKTFATSFKNSTIELSPEGLKANTAITTNSNYDYHIVTTYNEVM